MLFPMPPEEERKQLDYYRRLARQTQVIRITQAVNQLHQNRREALLVTPDEFSLLALTPQVDWNFLYEQAGVSKEVFFARAAQGIETDITFAHASSILIEVIDAVRPEIQWEREIALSRA